MSEYDLPEWAEAERRTLRSDVASLSMEVERLKTALAEMTKDRDEFKWMYDGLCK